MSRITDDRALWLANHILPQEAWLRRQLSRNNTAGLDVDDIVQEAYAQLIGLDAVDHIRNPRTYFYQVARNIILAHIRRLKVLSIETMADFDAIDVHDDGPLPDQYAEARQDLREVATAIASLPAKCREVYILRKIDGLSQREIADRLGTSESNVEKHLGRGVKALMNIFGRGGKTPARASMKKRMVSGEDHDEARDEQRN